MNRYMVKNIKRFFVENVRVFFDNFGHIQGGRFNCKSIIESCGEQQW